MYIHKRHIVIDSTARCFNLVLGSRDGLNAQQSQKGSRLKGKGSEGVDETFSFLFFSF